jgi:hypothetical protein
MADPPDPTPESTDRQQMGLNFPISLAVASRLVRWPADRIGDLFFEGWRTQAHPPPLVDSPADLLLIAAVVEMLDLVGLEPRDTHANWRLNPHALARLREGIAYTWQESSGAIKRWEATLIAGGPLPTNLSGELQSVTLDLDRIAGELRRRGIWERTTAAADPLGDELTDWLLDARRSAYQAMLAMQEVPAEDEWPIDSPIGPLSVRDEMFATLHQSLGALDTTILRIGQLQRALREDRKGR